MTVISVVARIIRKVLSFVKVRVEGRSYSKLASSYDFSGYKRIYLIHIRKTGGTSLNYMFLSLSGHPETMYNDLVNSLGHRIIRENKIFVGWNKFLIEEGSYYYAFSHIPLHQLRLPKETFTITCFRDPIKRIISHYNMLVHYRDNNIYHSCMKIEGHWLGNSVLDFVERMPKEHLLNQLYMFSSNFDVEEAIRTVEINVCCYFFTEDFDGGVEIINSSLGLDLEPIHMRKSSSKFVLSNEHLTVLKEKLRLEYSFLNKLKGLRN